jgi:hypothetical protein
MKGMITIAKMSNNMDFIRFAYALGVRDFRINMDYEQEAYVAIENISKLGRNDARCFLDFQGVKMRVQMSPLTNEIECAPGDVVVFYTYNGRFPYITHYDSISGNVSVGHTMSIADGKIIGKVIEISEESISVKLHSVNYVLRQNAGCSFIGSGIPETRMTKSVCQSIAKSKAILKRKANWVILSFVDSADEIIEFVNDMHHCGIKVMAKIETISGVCNIGTIGKVVDGFMIGRGDLKNTAKEQYEKYYQRALDAIKKTSKEFSGVGTFFLSHYSKEGNLTQEEKEDVLDIKNRGFDYVMLSKEVVNSGYPRETLEKLIELCAD